MTLAFVNARVSSRFDSVPILILYDVITNFHKPLIFKEDFILNSRGRYRCQISLGSDYCFIPYDET